MSRFKNEERVQIIANQSNYHLKCGTVVETDSASVRVIVDGEGRSVRFWDTELVPAPSVTLPAKELTHTQKYLRELEEDAKLLYDAAGLLPKGETKAGIISAAEQITKITATFRLLLSYDGVTLLEAEDVRQ
jgi:hypothetical protein